MILRKETTITQSLYPLTLSWAVYLPGFDWLVDANQSSIHQKLLPFNGLYKEQFGPQLQDFFLFFFLFLFFFSFHYYYYFGQQGIHLNGKTLSQLPTRQNMDDMGLIFYPTPLKCWGGSNLGLFVLKATNDLGLGLVSHPLMNYCNSTQPTKSVAYLKLSYHTNSVSIKTEEEFSLKLKGILKEWQHHNPPRSGIKNGLCQCYKEIPLSYTLKGHVS